jgi:hypothetical protein
LPIAKSELCVPVIALDSVVAPDGPLFVTVNVCGLAPPRPTMTIP